MGKETMPEPSSELDTATLNAPTTSSGSTERPTAETGPHLTMTQTQERDISVLAATKWTSGRPTKSLRLTPCTAATSTVKLNAKEPIAETTIPESVMTESATKTAATSAISAWEISNFSAPARPSTPTRR